MGPTGGTASRGPTAIVHDRDDDAVRGMSDRYGRRHDLFHGRRTGVAHVSMHRMRPSVPPDERITAPIDRNGTRSSQPWPATSEYRPVRTHSRRAGGERVLRPGGLTTSFLERKYSRERVQNALRTESGPRAGPAAKSGRYTCARFRSAASVVALAPVVRVIPAWIATFVPLLATIPAVVVVHIPAIAFPVTGEILTAIMVWLYPVRALIGRPCPVAVMPFVSAPVRILVPLNPLIVGAGPRRYPIGTRCRRFANLNAEGNLGVRDRRRGEEHCDDSNCVNESSHA
jgi:hypothetical protein